MSIYNIFIFIITGGGEGCKFVRVFGGNVEAGGNNNSIPKVKSDTAKGTQNKLKTGQKKQVGNYKKIGGGPLSERALQEAWIEDLLRKYYWLP